MVKAPVTKRMRRKFSWAHFLVGVKRRWCLLKNRRVNFYDLVRNGCMF